jgi:F0F1-type ATP synthase assembly protein I
VAEHRESRSRLAVGLEWASRITTIALEFSLPALLGYALDHWWHTTPAGTLVGAVLGFAAGMVHTLKLAQQPQGPTLRQ